VSTAFCSYRSERGDAHDKGSIRETGEAILAAIISVGRCDRRGLVPGARLLQRRDLR